CLANEPKMRLPVRGPARPKVIDHVVEQCEVLHSEGPMVARPAMAYGCTLSQGTLRWCRRVLHRVFVFLRCLPGAWPTCSPSPRRLGGRSRPRWPRGACPDAGSCPPAAARCLTLRGGRGRRLQTIAQRRRLAGQSLDQPLAIRGFVRRHVLTHIVATVLQQPVH